MPKPERIHISVAMSVTQHKLNSVQPNASTVSVWRHLFDTLSSCRWWGEVSPIELDTHREMGG